MAFLGIDLWSAGIVSRGRLHRLADPVQRSKLECYLTAEAYDYAAGRDPRRQCHRSEPNEATVRWRKALPPHSATSALLPYVTGSSNGPRVGMIGLSSESLVVCKVRP